MTYEAFLDWLDEDTLAEWVDGHTILMSPASLEHQNLAGLIYKALSEYVLERDMGCVLMAPFQMYLPTRPSGREPDVLFLAKENLGRLKGTWLDGPADLVVEVISKESRGRDTLDKRDEYEAGGVREYWLVDPEKKQVTQFTRRGKKFLAKERNTGRLESPLLKGFALDIAWLWAKQPPTLKVIAKSWDRHGPGKKAGCPD